jgi:hypothetical protein
MSGEIRCAGHGRALQAAKFLSLVIDRRYSWIVDRGGLLVKVINA